MPGGTVSRAPIFAGKGHRVQALRDAVQGLLSLRLLPASLLLFATAIVYLPALVYTYGYSDDYFWLAARHGWSPVNATQGGFRLGRPVSSWLVQEAFALVPSISALRFLRLVAIVGIACLAVLLYAALVRVTGSRWHAMLISLFAASMPALQVYASWAIIFYASWAGVAGAVSERIVSRAVEGTRRSRVLHVAGASAMLLLALAIYQPPAMLYWLFALLTLLEHRHVLGRVWRLVVLQVVAAVPALVGEYGLLRLGVHLYGGASPGRSQLLSQVGSKLVWFWHIPLYNAFNLFRLAPSLFLYRASVVVAAVGIILFARRIGRWAFLYLALMGAALFMTYLPSLLAQESYAAYRTQGALDPTAAVLVGLGVLGIFEAVHDLVAARRHLQPYVRSAFVLVAAGFACAAAVIATENVTNYFAEPQNVELRMVRQQLTAIPSPVTRVAYLVTCSCDGMTKQVYYDEFGVPSSAYDWVPGPLTFLILREQGRLDQSFQVTLAHNRSELPPNVPAIDVSKLAELRPG